MDQRATVGNGHSPRTLERMDVLEAIRTRRSVGHVRPEPPPRALIEQIIEAATWAPNHRLTEPWRFFVLAGEARVALGETMARSKVGPPTDDDPGQTEAFNRIKAKPLRAPVIVAVAVEPRSGPKVVEIEEVAAGAAAVQNLLLAAHALGLAAIWRTGDPAYDPAVKALFGLSERAHLLGFVYLGYPAGASAPARRTGGADLTTWLGWEDRPRITPSASA